jgi:hypothetical protein
MHVAGPVSQFHHVNRCAKLLLRIVAVIDSVAFGATILIGCDVDEWLANESFPEIGDSR